MTCLIPIYIHANYMVSSSHKDVSTYKILTAYLVKSYIPLTIYYLLSSVTFQHVPLPSSCVSALAMTIVPTEFTVRHPMPSVGDNIKLGYQRNSGLNACIREWRITTNKSSSTHTLKQFGKYQVTF